MEKLMESIEELKNSNVGIRINRRLKEFEEVGRSTCEDIFKELCFCILTANFNAERCIKIQQELGECFSTLSKDKLAKKLKEFGYRFPNTRTKYISESRKYKNQLKEIIDVYDSEKLRDWLVTNIRGLGYKEASHFLRNIGFHEYAIIDFHIVDPLVEYNLINRPNVITKKKYKEIEDVLMKLGEQTSLNLAALDLYLWYIETGKILK